MIVGAMYKLGAFGLREVVSVDCLGKSDDLALW